MDDGLFPAVATAAFGCLHDEAALFRERKIEAGNEEDNVATMSSYSV
jgi:hypothetical protein